MNLTIEVYSKPIEGIEKQSFINLHPDEDWADATNICGWLVCDHKRLGISYENAVLCRYGELDVMFKIMGGQALKQAAELLERDGE